MVHRNEVRRVIGASPQSDFNFTFAQGPYISPPSRVKLGSPWPAPTRNTLAECTEKKVTNARGGNSNHNFGIAWDVGIFDGGKYLTGDSSKEAKIYKALAAAVLTDDLEWGGYWKHPVDMSHYQLKLELSLAAVRARFEAKHVDRLRAGFDP